MMKLGRLFVVAFAVCAVWALAARAQEETKKQEPTKQERGAEAVKKAREYRKKKIENRTERHEGGGDEALIEKVDAEKGTITLKDDLGKEHVYSVDEHTKYRTAARGAKLHSLADLHLHTGSLVSYSVTKDGKLKEIFVMSSGATRTPTDKEESKKEETSTKPKEKKEKQ
jgi:hypothetical protein